MRDRSIADWLEQPPSAPCRLAGRLTVVDPDVLWLTDASGAVTLVVTGAVDWAAGDLVVATVVPTEPGATADAIATAQVVNGRRLVAATGQPDPSQLRLASRELGARLEQRATLRRATRDFFDRRGFLEVETGQLVFEPGQEPTLSPLVVRGEGVEGHHLITSPELRMKRLLVAGYERIYELSHCFRSGPGERSPWHHPEFTLLEWYRAFETEDSLIDDLEGLLRHAADALRIDGDALLRRAPFERITVAEAFDRYADIDLTPYLDGDDRAFRAEVERAGTVRAPAGEGVDTLFFRVLVERIEARLGCDRPTVLSGYPARMAALAELDPADRRLARRFELYVNGVELANAFFELNDPVEQRRRFEEERSKKREEGLDPGPMPERFLRALAVGMPPSAGIALGFDRLLMLLIGADRIDDVLPFPLDSEPDA